MMIPVLRLVRVMGDGRFWKVTQKDTRSSSRMHLAIYRHVLRVLDVLDSPTRNPRPAPYQTTNPRPETRKTATRTTKYQGRSL